LIQGDKIMTERQQFNLKVIDEFRANGGKVGKPFEGMPMVLVTVTGAKSGKTYTTPLVYSKDGNRFVIIASMAGAPNNPDWYHNIKANPAVTLEIGTERFQAKATVTSGEERERLFNAQAAIMPVFNDYRKKTTRQIPVIALERV
jgi:deazaflavin-dependent oxidoreductase (nitroreductase family)